MIIYCGSNQYSDSRDDEDTVGSGEDRRGEVVEERVCTKHIVYRVDKSVSICSG